MNPIQKVILKKIHSHLPGFIQNRYRFYKTDPDFIKVIEVQFLNLHNDKKAFTIHYGIYVPILYEILWKQTKPKSIEASECVFFCNINSILTEFKRGAKVKYWDIDDLEPLYDEITCVVRTNLYPFSEKIKTLEELNSLINQMDLPGKYVATYPILNLVLKYYLGRTGEAEQLINKLMELNPGFFNSQIEQVRGRLVSHGIDLC